MCNICLIHNEVITDNSLPSSLEVVLDEAVEFMNLVKLCLLKFITFSQLYHEHTTPAVYRCMVIITRKSVNTNI